MTNPNDGGPAFPSDHSGGTPVEPQRGMSLRAYMATEFTAAIIASGAVDRAHRDGIDPKLNEKATVFSAVAMADALIAELSKPQQPTT